MITQGLIAGHPREIELIIEGHASQSSCWEESIMVEYMLIIDE